MALLEILTYPDPRLRTKAQPVNHIDEQVCRIVEDMYETMYHAHGVGLAATQVNIHLRIFTMDISETKDQPFCFINPEITYQEGMQFEAEGCLSVGGGAFDKVKRAARVKLSAMDLSGAVQEWDAEGLMAVCFQHELDHLNGILFIDHLSRLKQGRIKTKIEKSIARK